PVFMILIAPAVVVVRLLSAAAGGEEESGKPSLVVVISVDQLRFDYLERYRDRRLPADVRNGGDETRGFRWLMEEGASFTDAHHDHYPLVTATGHAALLTGALPYKSGIVGNDWFDRDAGAHRYCVKETLRPSGEEIISPSPLRVTPGGDELALSTGARAPGC